MSTFIEAPHNRSVEIGLGTEVFLCVRTRVDVCGGDQTVLLSLFGCVSKLFCICFFFINLHDVPV